MDKILQILGILWQLPQFVLGWLLKWWYSRPEGALLGDYRGVEVLYSPAMRGGVALGNIVVLPRKYAPVSGRKTYAGRAKAHEYGHCLQSRRLGWLYLVVVGLPSLCWAWARSSSRRLRSVDYYSFWTERWADRLGGVER